MYGETTIKICSPRVPKKGGVRGGKNAKRLSRPGKAARRELETVMPRRLPRKNTIKVCCPRCKPGWLSRGTHVTVEPGSSRTSRTSKTSRAGYGQRQHGLMASAASLSDKQYWLWAEASAGANLSDYRDELDHVREKCFYKPEHCRKMS